MLRRYFIGLLVVVAYLATVAYVGLGLFLHIPHAVFLALLTGILELLPVIGPGAAAVIAGLVAMHYANGVGSIIAYAIYATALRISIDQLFGPLVLGTAARVHSVLVILCFLAGGWLFGVAGVILAVPVALVVKVTLAMLYDEPDVSERVGRLSANPMLPRGYQAAKLFCWDSVVSRGLEDRHGTRPRHFFPTEPQNGSGTPGWAVNCAAH